MTAVDDLEVDVSTVLEHIDNATLEGMQGMMDIQRLGNLRRDAFEEYKVPPSVSVAYAVMTAGVLILLAWLMVRKLGRYFQEEERGALEIAAATGTSGYKDRSPLEKGDSTEQGLPEV